MSKILAELFVGLLHVFLVVGQQSKAEICVHDLKLYSNNLLVQRLNKN